MRLHLLSYSDSGISYSELACQDQKTRCNHRSGHIGSRTKPSKKQMGPLLVDATTTVGLSPCRRLQRFEPTPGFLRLLIRAITRGPRQEHIGSNAVHLVS